MYIVYIVSYSSLQLIICKISRINILEKKLQTLYSTASGCHQQSIPLTFLSVASQYMTVVKSSTAVLNGDSFPITTTQYCLIDPAHTPTVVYRSQCT